MGLLFHEMVHVSCDVMCTVTRDFSSLKWCMFLVMLCALSHGTGCHVGVLFREMVHVSCDVMCTVTWDFSSVKWSMCLVM